MANPLLDFGELSLEDAIAQKAKQVDTLEILQQYLDEAPAYTKSGRDIKNPLTSRARMVSASKNFPLDPEAEGKTVSEVYKRTAAIRADNLMLDAIIEAKTPIPPAPAPATPSVPTPKVPRTFPWARLNPILNMVSGAIYSEDLNSGEDEELTRRRKYNKDTYNGN